MGACDPNNKNPERSDSIGPAAMKPELPSSTEAKAFEVRDSLGNLRGWGYDIYIDGQRTIHQPIIPGVSGTNSFKTEAEAKKVGDLVAAKILRYGGLQQVTIAELDSMNILR